MECDHHSGSQGCLRELIREDLVEGLRFPRIVDSFLEGEWRSWGDRDPVEPSDGESETLQALHRDIMRSSRQRRAVIEEAGCQVNTVCGRPEMGEYGFGTESVAVWSGTVVCPSAS